DAFHSIWCGMGAPSVLVTDKDLSAFITRQVKSMLIGHGVRHLVLPPYSPHLSFWERIHRDFVQMARSISSQVGSENDYIRSYLLAIRAFNCTAKGWIPFSPASLHFTYHQRLPGDPAASNDIVNYDALSAGTINTDDFTFARSMLPFVKEIQDKVTSSIDEYIEYWYHKQAEYRKRINLSTEKTYPDPKMKNPKIYKVIDFLKHKMVRVHLKMVNNINNNKMIMLSPKMINSIKPKTVTPSPMTTNWIKL
ncbi:hypothetical protein FOZ63_017162, partial [Perkinsus olseni]